MNGERIDLLSPQDVPAFRSTEGRALRWLVVCDHASHRVPTRLGDLGLGSADLLDHIGWDVGAIDAARRVARRLGAPMVDCAYSRLVIDCNRHPHSEQSMARMSDRRIVPGNRRLSAEQRTQRVRGIFAPYHGEIARRIDVALAQGVVPAILSVHSFTPTMGNVRRPWSIGIGWNRDRRMAAPALEALNRQPEIEVGDNEPYTIDLGIDFTIPEHAIRRGLPHLQIEFRQDLSATRAGAERLADLLTDAILSADHPSWRVCQTYFDAAELEAVGHPSQAISEIARSSL